MPKEGPQNGAARYAQLDSLRGLAAFTVVVGHFMALFPAVFEPVRDPIGWLRWSPLHLIWCGSEAVMLFFVLSGFVLALPFLRGTVPTAGFLIKRGFRIYTPYWAAIGLGMLLWATVYTGENQSLSEWFNQVWRGSLTAREVADHAFLLPSFENYRVVPVIWSLVHELRISLVFPLLMIPVVRWNWKWTALLAAAIFASTPGAARLFPLILGGLNDFADTVMFIPLFFAGALLAKHRNEIAEWVARRSTVEKILTLALAVCVYTWRWTVAPSVGYLHFTLLDHLMIGVGAWLFVVLALSSRRATTWLTGRALLWLGRVSYSLYLFHTVVLIGLIHVLYGSLPLPAILVIAFALSLVVAHLGYHLLEVPSMAIGRKIAKIFEPPKSPPPATTETAPPVESPEPILSGPSTRT